VSVQSMQALAHANHIRIGRSAQYRRLSAKEIGVESILDQRHDPIWARATIGEVLRHQRRWGEIRARRLLRSLGILESRRLGTLTDRQVDLIARALHA
jgi:hypothetical protein